MSEMRRVRNVESRLSICHTAFTLRGRRDMALRSAANGSPLPVSCRASALLLYGQLDAMQQLKKDAQRQLVTESHRHPISKLLETCPGLAEIRVAQLIPVVVTPHRFRTARQFWSYCGLGITMRSSSDWVDATACVCNESRPGEIDCGLPPP